MMPKMFRGQTARAWARRLELRGWPYDQAEIMSRFLTGADHEPPRWPDFLTAKLNVSMDDLLADDRS